MQVRIIVVMEWQAPRFASRRAVAFVIWAFLIQWGWEAIHAAAYVETAGPVRQRLRCCLPMGAIDAVWSFGLAVTARVIVRRADQSNRAAFFCVMAVFGAVTATILEWHALRTGRWTYNYLMPLIPGLGVGAFPVLQMAIVPIVAARLSGFPRPALTKVGDVILARRSGARTHQAGESTVAPRG